jgi:hypothetical protein
MEMATGYQKVSVNMSDEVLDELNEMATQDNLPVAEVLRKAISTLKFLGQAQRDGKTLLIRDPQTAKTERFVLR